jgi:hypothetical protein
MHDPPGVLEIRNRSRFGRVVSNPADGANVFSAVITLCASTAKRSRAALVPK